MNEDGLLDPVDESEDDWLRPELPAADPMKTIVAFVGDILATRHIIWPAARNGRLVPPPAEHILDALVRGSLDFGASAEWEAAWTLRPIAGTVVFKQELSDRCDICRARPARYDGYLLPTGAHAAWMCPWCFQRRSTLRLGIGEGQFVLRYSEVTDALWRRYSNALTVWHKRGAPVLDVDQSTYRDPAPKALAEPYVYVADSTASSSIARSFGALLSKARVRPDPAKGLFPENLIRDDLTLIYTSKPHPVDQVTQNLIFPEGAIHELNVLVGLLSAKAGVHARSLPDEIELVAARQIARVLLEGLGLSKAVGQLESSLKDYLGPTIVLAPIRGVEWLGPPRRFSDHFLIGRLNAEFHHELNEMSSCHGVVELRLDGGPSWAESYEHLLEDPASYEEIDAFHPVVVAQAVDSTPGVAIELALQKLRAFFGAILATHGLTEAHPGWGLQLAVSGEPNPTDEDYHNGCTIITLEHGSVHEHNYGVWYAGRPLALQELLGPSGSIVQAVGDWFPTDVKPNSFVSRIAACAKQYHAAVEAHDVDFTALHVAAAMEALLVRSDEEKVDTLARRVSCLLVEEEAREAFGSEVRRLYQLRSEAAHVGLSTMALAARATIVAMFVGHVPQLLERASTAHATGMCYLDWLAAIDG
jgi:hypothetical protein